MQAAFINFIRPRAPQRIQVNLNAITADGLIRVPGTRINESVKPGQLVEIFEPAGEVEGVAQVVRVNDQADLVYLDIKWDSLRELLPVLQDVEVSQRSASGYRLLRLQSVAG